MLIAMVAFVGLAVADRLPNQTMENQVFTIGTEIDVLGSVDDQTQVTWTISNPGYIPTGILKAAQSVAEMTYKDYINTNGGKLVETKNFAMDTRNKAADLFNIEADKVITYSSTDGSHLMGEESLSLDVAGNFSNAADTMRCVFASANSQVIPAFCNRVTAKSKLLEVTSAQIETRAAIRGVAKSADTNAALMYTFAVAPDASASTGYALGTFETEITVSIQEARDGYTTSDDMWTATGYAAGWNKTASEIGVKDTTKVSDQIKKFQKEFDYQSGMKF
jgi:hypothetical protein